ncbi:SIMPL domain-containing protein [Schumannella sp. 10F1B-5-1]|uniref:SIMPL domain-containing protein n=1 Tax=Schumannella sp. 10F1B-5-1 TaxID=2590780 RepID=UPI0011301889|nr:SIMPL domain-containing protein [Schumannella sp. 10F1B-5-1]TPW70622.1 SIMPL domain-containing protein [Schumannella sp. 10F1B-5-1]
MDAITITVQGEHESWHEAERATLELVVAVDGPEREPVFRRATETAAALTALIEPLHASGAVTRWSADRVRVTAQRPWNNQGKRLPLVHSTSVGVRARFRDRDALADVIARLSDADGVTIAGIRWDLSEETRRAALATVRGAAVRAALEKGKVYARAVGLENVAPLAIADPGMLGDASPSSGGGGVFAGAAAPLMARSRGAAGGGEPPQLDLTPERIRVAAQVDVRLHAS